MTWFNPIKLNLVPTSDSDSWSTFSENETGLPTTGHVGSFGHVRKFHTHEGIDLYVPKNTPVFAVEDGEIVAIEHFTGPGATPPTPWWNDTWAVLVEGKTGVVIYGEITPVSSLKVGDRIKAGENVGIVDTPVLTKDKGRPTMMLHLELHTHGARESKEWPVGSDKPKTLIDPTIFLEKSEKTC